MKGSVSGIREIIGWGTLVEPRVWTTYHTRGEGSEVPRNGIRRSDEAPSAMTYRVAYHVTQYSVTQISCGVHWLALRACGAEKSESREAR